MNNPLLFKEYFNKDYWYSKLPRPLVETPLLWVTPLIIIGVLLLSIALPYRVSSQQLLLVIAIFPAIAGALVILRWPPLGIILLIIICLIAPSPYLPGGLNVAVIFLGALFGIWVFDKFVNRSLRPTLTPTTKPLVAFIVISFISFAVGQLDWFSFGLQAPLDAQLGGLSIFLFAGFAFLLVGYQIKDIRWLQAMTWTFLAFGALFIAGWIVPGLGGFTGRLFRSETASNSMLWVWIVALAFSQFIFNKDLSLGPRILLGVLVAATIYVGFFINRDWKSGYIPPLAALAAVLALRSWKLALLLIVVGILPAQLLLSQAISTEEYSYGTRIDAWIIVLNMVKLNPLLGFGPANYYWYTQLFPIRGWYVVFNSHNQYIDLLAQIGVLGLGSVLWFFTAVGRLGWQLRTRVPQGFAQAFVYGALGGLVGTLVSGMFVDWFLPFVYNIGLTGFRGSLFAWLFLGGLISLKGIYMNSTEMQVVD